jgi:hypothetical protein
MTVIEKSQRGKSPKAGKGVGRKPAPESLEPIAVRIPASRAKWLREHIKPRKGGISGWVSEMVRVEMEKKVGGWRKIAHKNN